MEIGLLYFGGLFLLFCFCFFLSMIPHQKHQRSILLSLGLITSISIYAILQSGGNSIFLVALLPIGAFFYRNHGFQKPRFPSQTFFFLFISYSIFWLFQFINILLDTYATDQLPAFAKDHFFYADIMHFLKALGTENTYNIANVYAKVPATPYHYSELWLGVLCSHFSDLPVLYAFNFIAIPILLSFLHLSAYDYIKSRVNQKDIVLFLFTLFTFLMGGMFFEGLRTLFFVPFNVHTYGLSIFIFSKIMIPCLLIMNALHSENAFTRWIIIALLPICSVTFLPITCAFAGLYFLYQWFTKQKTWLPLFPFIGVVIMIVFYVLFNPLSFSPNTKEGAETSFSLLSTINYFIGRSLSIFIIWLPLIGLTVFYLFKKWMSKQVGLLIGLTTLALFTVVFFQSLFLKNLTDSFQLFSNPTICLALLLNLVLATYSFQQKKLAIAHSVIILALAFPWFSKLIQGDIYPSYGKDESYHWAKNAFQFIEKNASSSIGVSYQNHIVGCGSCEESTPFLRLFTDKYRTINFFSDSLSHEAYYQNNGYQYLKRTAPEKLEAIYQEADFLINRTNNYEIVIDPSQKMMTSPVSITKVIIK